MAPRFLLVLSVIAAAVLASAPRALASAEPGQPAPALVVKELSGNTFDLSAERGKVTIVNFWATWCPPCRKQIPELESIYKHYQSRGLMVVGVSCDTVQGDGVKAVGPFIRRFRITYPILLANDALVDKLDLDVLPTTMFVDRDGHLVSRIRGAGRIGELSDNARELMAR
jgi:thiol-disulfide isomerase/thioredoxin